MAIIARNEAWSYGDLIRVITDSALERVHGERKLANGNITDGK